MHPNRISSGVKAPFAALPHSIAGDPKISPLDKAVLLALLFWARSKDHCWPGDASIADRIGKSIPTVQRSLRSLESLGLVIRKKTNLNRTNRMIYLAWKMVVDDRPKQSTVIDHPPSPMIDKENVIVKAESLKETPISAPERRRPDESPKPAPKPTPTPEAIPGLTAPEQSRLAELSPAIRDRVLTFLATDSPCLHRDARRLLCPRVVEPSPDSIPLEDLLMGLPGRPDRIAVAAGRLSQELRDQRSFQYYRSVAEDVCQRSQSPESLVAALAEGMNPQSKRPGAVFAYAWKRESRASL